MSKLLSAFRQEIGKNTKLGQESKPMPTFSTGLDVFDYRNGKYDVDGELQLGVDGGKIVTVVGRSGTGKTSLVIQMATNIAEQFPESQVFHMDAERATDPSRIMTLSGWSHEKFHSKYIHMNTNVNTESVYATIKAIADMKLKMREELEYDTGKQDVDGNPIMALQPTVMILDSLAVLTPEDLEKEEEMSGQMAL